MHSQAAFQPLSIFTRRDLSRCLMKIVHIHIIPDRITPRMLRYDACLIIIPAQWVAWVTGYDFLLLLFEKYRLILKVVVFCTDIDKEFTTNA